MANAEKIATVLAEHQWYDGSSDREDPVIGCTGCDDWFSDENALDNGVFAAHQAAMLEPVIREVKAAVLEEATECFGENQSIREGDVKEWLRMRAAGIREGKQ